MTCQGVQYQFFPLRSPAAFARDPTSIYIYIIESCSMSVRECPCVCVCVCFVEDVLSGTVSSMCFRKLKQLPPMTCPRFLLRHSFAPRLGFRESHWGCHLLSMFEAGGFRHEKAHPEHSRGSERPLGRRLEDSHTLQNFLGVDKTCRL